MKLPEKTNSDASLPSIWLVIGDKPGDNAQVEIIAEALGLPFKIKRVLSKQQFVFGKPDFKPSLYHLDPERSDQLEPPWPDFIFTIGSRPSMAALWIRKQSLQQSKIILLGRPKKWIEQFELVIVPTQYNLPARPNILQLNLPLMRSNEAAIAAAAQSWNERFSTLNKPVTALLIGGPTKPFRFDADTANKIVRKTVAIVEESGGTLYVSTSRRTPLEVVTALQANLPDNALLYCWDADNTQANPYLALLGLADRFIVTGDSVSMMVEIARLGKPLAIYSLPYQQDLGTKIRLFSSRTGKRGYHGSISSLLIKTISSLLRNTGLAGYTRDLTAIHELLYAQNLAVPAGKPFLSGGRKAEDEVDRVTRRVRQVIVAG
ncbi:MAG: ELM1/GtrOC1 family putative glycosyltransferase [Gammaproteobacteria bacterium]